MVKRQRLLYRFGVLLSGIGLLLLLGNSNPRVLSLLGNTVLLSAATCGISLPVGTMLALLLLRTDVPGSRLALLLLAAMLFLPLYLQAAAWDAGFGQFGWLSLAQGKLADPLLRGWLAAIWIHATAAIAWVALLVGVALHWSDGRLEEVARLDGSLPQVFFKVTLRRCLPAIAVATLWVALLTAGEMTVTDLYDIRTFAEELYTGFAWYEGVREIPGWRAALYLSSCLAGLTIMAIAAFNSGVEQLPAGCRTRYRLGGSRWLLMLVVWGVLLVLIGVPIANLVYKAGLRVDRVGLERVRYWSGEQFIQFVLPLPGDFRVTAAWQYQREFFWTLTISACTATTVLVLSVLLAMFARRGKMAALPAVATVACGMAFSGPLVGLAVVWLRTSSRGAFAVWLFDETIFGAVLATSCRGLPLAVMICWVAVGTLNRRILEAATLDGAGSWRQFLKVVVPQRKRAFAFAWLVAFALAFGDLSASILVMPPGIMTVPMRVFDQLHAGVNDRVAAICLTSLAGFLLIAALAAVLAFPWIQGPAGQTGHGDRSVR